MDLKNKLTRWQVTISLMATLTYCLYYFGRYHYGVMLPFIQAEFSLSNLQLGIFATILTAGYSMGQFVNGFLIDKYGSRLMLTLGAVLSSLANVATGLGFSYKGMLVTWLMVGYTQAMGFGSTCKLYTEWFPVKNRGKVLGFQEGMQSLTTAIVPIVTAIVITKWGWRSGFMIPVIPLFIVGLLSYMIIKNRPSDVGLKVDWAIPPLSGGLLDDAKEAYRNAFSDWRMLLTYVSYGFSQFVFFALATWIPIYIFNKSGNILEAAWVLTGLGIGGLFGGLIMGFGTDLIKKRYPLITIGLCFAGISLIVFALMPNASITVLSILMVLCGVGLDSIEVPLFLLPMDILEEKGTPATGTGCLNAIGKLFATFQGVMFGLLIDATGSFSTTFLVIGGLAIFGGLIVIPINR